MGASWALGWVILGNWKTTFWSSYKNFFKAEFTHTTCVLKFPDIAKTSSVTYFAIIAPYPGLGIRSFDLLIFDFSIFSIFKKDRPWSNRSHRSFKKIDRDRIDLTISKNNRFDRKTDGRIPNPSYPPSPTFPKPHTAINVRLVWLIFWTRKVTTFNKRKKFLQIALGHFKHNLTQYGC